MSERNISISPYLKADNLIDLKGFISIDGIDEKFDIPEKKHLILYNYSLSNGDVLIPRNHSHLKIVLKPTFLKPHSRDDFDYLLIKGESHEKVLKLRIQVWCKKTRWCSDQLSITLTGLSESGELSLFVPLSEIKEEIVISGFVTREKGNGIIEERKASSIYSVLSNCEDIVIQIDERKEIGGSHLPIYPEDIGELLFDIQGLEDDFNLPVIKYSEDFQPFFVKDTLNIVNATFMMSMFYFLDTYLKWLIFHCKYDPHDKNHKGLVQTFTKYCDISKTTLVQLVGDKKFSEEQTKQYLNLSHKLLHGMQINSPVKYAKELKQMIKDEIK